MKTIRVAIVGQGRSGRGIHAEYLQHVPGKFTIAAVADPLKDRRDRAVREFGCDAYASHKPLLRRNDIDLVVNATPSHLHVPYTLEFLNAGFNVLCEKPLAAKVKDVDRLIAAQKKRGTVFAVFQQSRYAPYFQQVRKVIDSGVLGDLVQVNIQFNGFNRRYDCRPSPRSTAATCSTPDRIPWTRPCSSSVRTPCPGSSASCAVP